MRSAQAQQAQMVYPDADGGTCDAFRHSDIYHHPMPEKAGGWLRAGRGSRSAGPETGRVQCAPIVNPIRRQITGRSFMWSPDVTQEHGLGGPAPDAGIYNRPPRRNLRPGRFHVPYDIKGLEYATHQRVVHPTNQQLAGNPTGNPALLTIRHRLAS
jgi:hypothetical protein